MQKSISTITSYISHLLFRTRPTERLTETLTVAELQKLARYDGTLPYADKRVRALVWEVKYYKDSRAAKIAGEYLAGLLLAEAADTVGTPLLIPMPMHAKRRRERGHNQTEVLCEAALPFFSAGFAYAPNALTRIRHTAPQQGLERHHRLKNVKGSMQVLHPEKIKGRMCIVTDDVTTTGASFAEAKRALKAAGAADVHCIALAQS